MKTDPASLRRMVYLLLITLAAGVVGGHILSANLVYEPYLHRNEWEKTKGKRLWPAYRPEPMPTFSSNDRSRWCTIRALVEEGTFEIGERPRSLTPEQKLSTAIAYLSADNALEAVALGAFDSSTRSDRGIVMEDGWRTVDKVLHPERFKFYSSKPPLLPVIVAGEYWVLKHGFGLSIADQQGRWLVVQIVLLTVNWLPLLLYLWMLARLVDRNGTTDWGRIFVVAAGCFGTFLNTFATTLNNHSVAAYAAMFALYPALRIWAAGRKVAPVEQEENGFAAASPGLFVLAGFFAGFTATNELPAAAFAVGLSLLLLLRAPVRTLIFFVPAALLPYLVQVVLNYIAIGQLSPAYAQFGTDWYEYEGSHWQVKPGQVKTGIDFATETKPVYGFHLLFGHHGIFSLTPINLFAAVGMVLAAGFVVRRFLRNDREGGSTLGRLMDNFRHLPGLPLVSALTLLLSVVIVGFYIFKSNNYGGWTSGPRWFFWLTPLWLLAMLPVVDWLAARRWGRVLACVLLALSVLSASFPTANPWRMPWLYHVMEAKGWIDY